MHEHLNGIGLFRNYSAAEGSHHEYRYKVKGCDQQIIHFLGSLELIMAELEVSELELSCRIDSRVQIRRSALLDLSIHNWEYAECNVKHTNVKQMM